MSEKFLFSPFDDPIVGACFASVETAGEAIRSFSNSITAKDDIYIAKVTSVVPQSYYKMYGQRGTRVDVRSKTATNQDIIASTSATSWRRHNPLPLPPPPTPHQSKWQKVCPI